MLGNELWPQTAKQEGDKISKKVLCNIWKKNAQSVQKLEVSLVGVETVLPPSRKGCVVNGVVDGRK